MDANKLKKLQGVGFSIRAICGLCAHGTFRSDEWGTCGVHTYEHEKHTEGTRQLSVHFAGTCDAFKWTPDGSIRLGTFTSFAEEKP